MNIYEVIRRPLVTEKGTRLSESGKYVFEIDKKANKSQVKKAVEAAFKVSVVDVNIIRVPGETKRLGRREVTRQPWKKAIVTLKAGDKIQYFEGV